MDNPVAESRVVDLTGLTGVVWRSGVSCMTAGSGVSFRAHGGFMIFQGGGTLRVPRESGLSMSGVRMFQGRWSGRMTYIWCLEGCLHEGCFAGECDVQVL